VTSGPLIGRAGWLLTGVIVVWLGDVARILTLFAADRAWGDQPALQPLVGLVTFNVSVLAMTLALPRFRLRIDFPALARRVVGDPSTRVGIAPPGRPPVRQLSVGLVVLMAAGAVGGMADGGLRQFELVATPLGQPLLQPSAVSSHPVRGWAVRKTGSYSWITIYLGRNASWDRYQYWSPADEAQSSPSSSLSPVTLDLLTTLDRSALVAYGLEGPYHLHDYQLLDAGGVDLGGGVIGESVVYRSRLSPATWTAVYWDWPVQAPGATGYERVVLYLANRVAAKAREFLTGFGREVVLASARRPG
jgi:hypothetical protein